MQLEKLQQLAEALEGMPIWGCIPGSPSAQAGVRAGDVLLWANGVRVRNFDDYLRAKALREGEVSVVVFRDGEELAFTMRLDRWRLAPRALAEALSDGKLIPICRRAPREAPEPTN